MHPLRDRVADQAVDTDRRQHQCQSGEDAEQRGLEPPRRQRFPDHLLERLHPVERQVGVEPPDRVADWRDQALRVACGADHQRGGGDRGLELWTVDLHLRLVGEVFGAHVTHDPDHLHPLHVRLGGIAEGDAPAARVLARPDPLRQHMVDDHYRQALAVVLGVEGAPLQERDPHRGEIVEADETSIGGLFLSRLGRRPPLGRDCEDEVGVGERQRLDRGRVLGSRQGAEAVERLLEEGRLARLVGITGFGQRNPRGDHTPRIEAGADRLETREAP